MLVPLHVAADRGCCDLASGLLLSGSVGVNDVDSQGWTALMIAARKGHSHVMRVLLQAGADVTVVASDLGFTAVYIAAQNGHLAALKLLIKAGADLACRDLYGSTPLHLCAQKGRIEMIRALRSAGADLDARAHDGATPLFEAANRGQTSAVRELLRANASPSLPLVSETSLRAVPLDTACEKGHEGVVRELMMQRGIAVCGGRSYGAQALFLAAQNGRVAILDILMEAGAIDPFGHAFIGAAGFGGEATVKHLLRRQGTPERKRRYVNDARDSLNRTALFTSVAVCCSCCPRVVRLLVDAGADATSPVRARSVQGGAVTETPLALTARYLQSKQVMGNDATREQLHTLEAVRRLLLRLDAAHAISWTWPCGVYANGTSRKEDSSATPSPLAAMLPILRRRADSSCALLVDVFGYSRKL